MTGMADFVARFGIRKCSNLDCANPVDVRRRDGGDGIQCAECRERNGTAHVPREHATGWQYRPSTVRERVEAARSAERRVQRQNTEWRWPPFEPVGLP